MIAAIDMQVSTARLAERFDRLAMISPAAIDRTARGTKAATEYRSIVCCTGGDDSWGRGAELPKWAVQLNRLSAGARSVGDLDEVNGWAKHVS